MRFTTSPILTAAADNSCTRALVLSASRTARAAISDEDDTCRLISATEPASSSAALATDCTLPLAEPADRAALQALANEEHGEQEHEKDAGAGDERHALDAVPEHRVVNLDRHAGAKSADHFAFRTDDRLVGRIKLVAE